MKNKILAAVGIGLALIIIIVIVVLAGSGRLFQGALYNLRPIYTACKIEGQNYNSTNTDDCETFHDKLEKTLPDGEYTIFTTYTDKKLNQGIIPIRMKDHKVSCTFNEAGYQAVVNVTDPNNQLGTQTIKSTTEIPVGLDGMIAQINYSKNNQVYPYDTNICESSFEAQLMDTNKAPIGNALLDHNGFINSRPLVNEVLIKNAPYYSNLNGEIVKQFTPGNIFVNFNAAPDLTFKLTIPCSSNFPVVTIPSITTAKDTSILLQGLTPQYLNTCGSKLYLGFQNANRSDDSQNFTDIKLIPGENNSASYELKLDQLTRINNKNTVLPFIYTVKLFSRERADEKEIQTLGTGVLTITDKYKPVIVYDTTYTPGATPDAVTPSTPAPAVVENAAELASEKAPANTEAPQIVEETSPPLENKAEVAAPLEASGPKEMATEIAPAPAIPPKVRRNPEAILVLKDNAETPLASQPKPVPEEIKQPAPTAAPEEINN